MSEKDDDCMTYEKRTLTERSGDTLIVDTVYMLVKRGPPDQLWYSPPATSIPECWKNAAVWDHPYHPWSLEEFRKRMKKQGWRAEKVRVKRGWL